MRRRAGAHGELESDDVEGSRTTRPDDSEDIGNSGADAGSGFGAGQGGDAEDLHLLTCGRVLPQFEVGAGQSFADTRRVAVE